MSKRAAIFISLVLLLGIAWTDSVQAQEPVILTDEAGKYPLGLHLSYLEDPTGQLTIEDVTSPGLAGQFIPSNEKIPNFGVTSSAYWVRFQLVNQASASTQWRLEVDFPSIHAIELYLPDRESYIRKRTGYVFPFSSRDVSHHNFVFDLPLASGADKTFYMRVENAAMSLPLTVWSLEAFSLKNQQEYLWLGFYYGILLIMLVYNLFLYLSLRDISYLYYIAFIGSYIIYQGALTGLTNQYLWPEVTWLNYFIIPLSAEFVIIFLLKFSSEFLLTKTQTPTLHRIINICVVIWALLIIPTPFVGAIIIAPELPLALFSLLLMWGAGVITWLRGYRPARYYLLAWSLFLGMSIFSVVVRLNLFPLPMRTATPEISTQLGAALLVSLLSFALADRINLLRDSVEQANRDLQASERQYRGLFENSKDAILITTLEGKVIDANPACLKLFGYSMEEREEIQVQTHYADPDRDRLVRSLREKGFVQDFEIRLLRRDGTPRDCLLTSTLEQPDDSPIPYAQTIVRDITEQKKAEQQRLELIAIQQELAIARDIQKSLLPPPRPNWSEIEVVCRSIPAHEVGGDFYRYHRFEEKGLPQGTASNGRYAIAVGDVSGKGVSAALLMATSLSQFDVALSLSLSPARRMAYLDEVIAPYTRPRRQNCAMCYVEITPPANRSEPGHLQIINAGCIPPYIKRAAGPVEHPEIGGFALGQGLGAEKGYDQLQLNLTAGDLIILTSDGVVEAKNSRDELLGFDRLRQIIRQGPATDATALLEHISQEVIAFTGQAEQHDDMTLVVVRV